MKQPIALRKQSKRAQREYHKKQRGSWYGVDPVTRTIPNGKAYHRARAKRMMEAGWGRGSGGWER